MSSFFVWGNTASFRILEDATSVEFGSTALGHHVDHYALAEDHKVALSSITLTWTISKLVRSSEPERGSVGSHFSRPTLQRLEIFSTVEEEHLNRIERAFLAFLATPNPKVYVIGFRFEASREQAGKLMDSLEPIFTHGSPTLQFHPGMERPLQWPEYVPQYEKKRRLFK